MLVEGVQIGAPGVYYASTPPSRELLGVRMDVCAFAGVAPRGPARVPFTDEELIEADLGPGLVSALLDASPVDPDRPRRRSVAVPVESWDDYVRLFGAFEGPGRLPYAVASFFEQGGRRAYVVRIVHDYLPSEEQTRTWATAVGRLRGFTVDGRRHQLLLRARNEGSWGNRLAARVSFTTQPLPLESAAPGEVVVAPGSAPAAGTLLRLRLSGGTPDLRLVAAVERVRDPVLPRDHAHLLFDSLLPGVPESAEIVEGVLEIDDGDGRSERFERLAFGAAHRRRIGAVLCEESELLYPGSRWADADVVPRSADLHDVVASRFRHGRDDSAALTPYDFFDASWVLGDQGPAGGVHAVLDADEVATLVVPDLYEPSPLPEGSDVLDPSTAGPEFAECVDIEVGEQEAQVPDLPGLQLDPNDPVELEEIVGHQRRLAELATLTQAFVVLLDVPPGLDQSRIVRWRGRFDTSYAAAYCPWLEIVRSLVGGLVKTTMNPSAFAAGIVASRELRFGVPFGPSNELAAGAVGVADAISPARHAELHPLGINVFLRERDGMLLTAARTLSTDPSYRQLSVRRLMMMLVRTLERELQWVVFEPNNRSLQADLRHLLRAYLGRLYRANAFVGATEDEAFFVHCDERLNTQSELDAGRLVAEIGVAPAEPLEFIVVRLLHNGDGTLLVAEGAR